MKTKQDVINEFANHISSLGYPRKGYYDSVEIPMNQHSLLIQDGAVWYLRQFDISFEVPKHVLEETNEIFEKFTEILESSSDWSVAIAHESFCIACVVEHPWGRPIRFKGTVIWDGNEIRIQPDENHFNEYKSLTMPLLAKDVASAEDLNKVVMNFVEPGIEEAEGWDKVSPTAGMYEQEGEQL